MMTGFYIYVQCQCKLGVIAHKNVERGVVQFFNLHVYITYIYIYHTDIPVVPHKAVAEVSRIGHYRRD